MKPKRVDEIISTNEFQIFISTAREFCLLIEKDKDSTENQFLIELQQHLLKLYTLGFNLPSVWLDEDTDFDINIDDDEMKFLLKRIADKVQVSYYWAVLNPVDDVNLAKTGTGDLVDDLADIYKDLKKALTSFDKHERGAKEHAIFQFKFTYDYHWGEHCIEALYAIHHYLSEQRI